MSSNSNPYQELTLRDYVRVLFRHKAVIVTAIATVLTTTFIGLKLKTPVYEAKVKVLISGQKQVEASYYREINGGRDAEISVTQSEMVKSNPVLERAVKALRLYQRPLNYERQFASPLKAFSIDSQTQRIANRLKRQTASQQQMILFRMAINDLRGRITVQPIRDTNLFTISVTEFSPIGAAITANAVSRSYVIFDLEQQLAELRLKYGEKHQTVQQLTDNIRRMSESLSGGPISDIDAIGPASVKIVEQASIPMEPVGPKKALILALAGLMSLFLAVILAFLFDYLDPSLKSPGEVTTVLGLPLLGSIPQRRVLERPLIEDAKRTTRYVRFYQSLGDQIYLLAREKSIQSILFTSALKGEGVTTVVANLGFYLANKAGYRVLVIDGNLRRPGIRRMLQLPDHPGLADVLQSTCTFEQAVQRKLNLSILGAGERVPNPVALLVFSRMAEMIRTAKSAYDLILVDGPNLQEFTDSAVIAATMDSLAFVVNEGRTRRQVIRSALGTLEQVKGNLLGGVMNRRRFVVPKLIYEWV